MRRHEGISAVVLISFAELAWIALFVLLIYHHKVVSAKPDESDWIRKLTQLQKEKDLIQTKWDELMKRQAGLLQELDLQKSRHEQEVASIKKDISDKQRQANDSTSAVRYAEYFLSNLLDNTSSSASASAKGELPDLLRATSETIARHKDTLTSAQEKIISLESAEFQIRTELVGFKRASFDRVAILFDTSDSLRKSRRWEIAQNVVRSWLTYLPMRECVLIQFSDSVSPFPGPPPGSFLRLRDEKLAVDEGNRHKLVEHIQNMPIHGNTNTPAALKKALEYDRLDTVFLFTDGWPFVGSDVPFSKLKDQMLALTAECKKRNITIHTIALGDYDLIRITSPVPVGTFFQSEFTQLLQTMANETGGIFMAR